MTKDGWKELIFMVVRDADAGNQEPVEDLAKLLEKLDLATQKLRDHGFGWTGLDILETVDQVIESL